YPAAVEIGATGQEALTRELAWVVGRPDPQPLLVAGLHPIEPAGETGLDRHLRHLRHTGEGSERALVAPAGKGLAPGRAENPDAVALAPRNPADEALQRQPIALVLLGALAVLGEGAVVAAVVAA